jgi:hypothetical protein
MPSPEGLPVVVICCCERWGTRYEERLGSDRYIPKQIELVLTAVEGKGTLQDQVDGDSLFILSGGEIRQEQFIR